ncbi:MAG: EAL domain-containing protein [Paracoccus sp. (in: a-proteobacteria)]
MHYRPQVCCNTGRVLSLLAVPPVHLYNRTDAILHMILKQYRDWQSDGVLVPPAVISLPHQIACSTKLAQPLIWEIDRQETNPDQIMFSLSAHTNDSLPGQTLLTDFGCSIELSYPDQTGIRLLNMLSPGSVRLRIPAELTRNEHIKPQQGQAILSVLALAERHGMTTIASHVETRESYGFLAQLGCDAVQGDIVAPILDADGTAHFLRQYATLSMHMTLLSRPAA